MLILIFILTASCLISCGYIKIDTQEVSDFDSTFLKAREYCSPAFLKTEYDPSDGVRTTVADYPEMLPRLTDNSKIISYCAKCVEELPVGESVQILVSIKYDSESDYNSEKQRISDIEAEEHVLIDNELFDRDAIVSSASLMDVCEYVICYDAELTLNYVYLQSVKEEDVVFDKEYLPRGYFDYSKIKGLEFSIYHDVIEDNDS